MYAISLLAALVQVAPSPADTTPDPIIVEQDRPDRDRVVCERSQATGSKLYRRECRTVAEWEAIRTNSRADFNQYLRDTEHLRQSSQSGPSPAGPQPTPPR